ncbi:hypothetical protein RFI_34644 [Reticulomyxa filosa]|uniref:DH domain-containing protein n=1 Tax=Reticulomyxa filosa TaxID=46433 RepID=X6LLE4_RETFI|nr:hypothetical protein RFI_34644 [Reticulomyxa filosa]|eukprot:ETO02768.1 hypothetical protein RFI_34644 [Reticulomyxa filosa]
MDQMTVLMENYLIPFRKEEILLGKDCAILFRNIDKIAEFERGFREQLKKNVKQKADIAIKYINFSKLLTQWSKNLGIYLNGGGGGGGDTISEFFPERFFILFQICVAFFPRAHCMCVTKQTNVHYNIKSYLKGQKQAMEVYQHQCKMNSKFHDYCRNTSGNTLVYLLELPCRYVVGCYELVSQQIQSISNGDCPLYDYKMLQEVQIILQRLSDESKYTLDGNNKTKMMEDKTSMEKNTKVQKDENCTNWKEKTNACFDMDHYLQQLKQVYNNEQIFLYRMNFLLDHYIRPIQSNSNKPLMSQTQFLLVFRNLNEIVQFIQQFFTKWKHRCDNLHNQLSQTNPQSTSLSSDMRIMGDLFLQFNSVLPKLQKFILDQSKAEETLDELFSENQTWCDFYQHVITNMHSKSETQSNENAMANNPRPRLKLRYLLQYVCYRPVYYCTMFHDILNSMPTPTLHPDAKDLLSLLQNIEKVLFVDFVENLKKRRRRRRDTKYNKMYEQWMGGGK